MQSIPIHLFNLRATTRLNREKKNKTEMQKRETERESNVIKRYVISSIRFEKRDAELKRSAPGSRPSVLHYVALVRKI